MVDRPDGVAGRAIRKGLLPYLRRCAGRWDRAWVVLPRATGARAVIPVPSPRPGPAADPARSSCRPLRGLPCLCTDRRRKKSLTRSLSLFVTSIPMIDAQPVARWGTATCGRLRVNSETRAAADLRTAVPQIPRGSHADRAAYIDAAQR